MHFNGDRISVLRQLEEEIYHSSSIWFSTEHQIQAQHCEKQRSWVMMKPRGVFA
jgi:hypothetical protein